MPIPAVPALVAASPAIASAISSAINFISGGHANRANIRNQNELLRKQFQMQQELNANGALVQKQGLERAGMNVLSQFGPNMNLSSPTPSKSDIIAPQADLSGVAQMAQMMQQQPLVEAQAEKTQAEADAQNILNEREKSKDKGANKYMTDMLSDTSLFGDGFENVVSADISGPALPDTVKTGKGHKFNYGDFEFYKISKEFGNQLKEFDYNDAKWTLEKMILKAQGEDKEVLQSIIQLPKAQLSQIIEQTNLAIQQSKTSKSQGELFDAEKALANLQKKLAEDNNMSQIFEGMLKDGLTVENVGKMLIACFVNFFKSSVSFSFSH